MSVTDPDLNNDEAATPSRKRATLARLLKEARLAFSAKGLAGTRVDDIARAAGVTKQLVYHYFHSKEQLFASVLDESAQDLLADLLTLELDHLPPTEALRVLLMHLLDMYRDDPTLGSLAQESIRLHEHDDAHQSRFARMAPVLVSFTDRILRRGERTGEFVAGVDARLFCAAAGLLVTSGFTNHYIVSTTVGFDTAGAEGMGAWGQYAVDFVLGAVLAGGRPSLGRQPTPS